MPVNMKALKARMRSVDSTRHITKAMELVASSKIKKATLRMEESRFYRKVMEEAFEELARTRGPYSESESPDAPALYIAIAGDRGLAGGYNGNVFKAVRERIQPGDFVLPVGKRSTEYFKRYGYPLFTEKYTSCEKLSSNDCADVGKSVTKAFDDGKIGAVYLVYTEFVNMLTQEARRMRLLPLTPPAREPDDGKTTERAAAIVYEPDPESVLSALIPEYIAGILYSSVCMSLTSELAARRQAMDTATKNADEMIERLNLQYNRARQSAITQEITEIIAGADGGASV